MLQSMGLQRVRGVLVTEQQQDARLKISKNINVQRIENGRPCTLPISASRGNLFFLSMHILKWNCMTGAVL